MSDKEQKTRAAMSDQVSAVVQESRIAAFDSRRAWRKKMLHAAMLAQAELTADKFLFGPFDDAEITKELCREQRS